MDRKTKTTSAIATAVVGAAIAASTFGFSANGTASTPSDHDSFRVSTSYSDHDSFGSIVTGAGQSAAIGASGDQSSTAEFTGRRGQGVTIATAPNRSTSNTSAPSSSDDRRLSLVSPELRLHDSECADVAVLDLSARAAADCGLDAGAYALALAADTARNLQDNVDRVKTAAVDTVGVTARFVRDTTLETVQGTTQTATDVADRATVYAVDTAGQALRNVRDTTLEAVSTVGNLVADQTACATGLTADVLDTSVNDALDCAS